MEDRELFEEYCNIFKQENHKVNLISKNDEQLLWEKHICDSLALEKFFNKYGIPRTILDIGTGGGFPAVPLAIKFPKIKITAIDSIGKKIKAVQVIKDKLGLDNLTLICSRVENLNSTFDVTTSRAVASLDKICSYALPLTSSDGYFVPFKSKKIQQEITESQKVLNKYHSKIIDIIEYELPLKENFERYLAVIKRYV